MAVLLALLVTVSFSGFWSPAVYADDSINVSGRFTFAGGEPVRYAYVEVMDSEFGPDELRASGFTDSSGYYSFSGLNNDDGWGQDGRDIYVKCYARNWAADVIGNPRWMPEWLFEGDTYTFKTSTKDDVDDGDVDMGTKDAPGDVDEAFNVFDTINKGYDFLAGVGLDPGQVTVFWDDWFVGDMPWPIPDINSYYMPWSVAERYTIPDDWVAFIAAIGALTWATWWWGPVVAAIDITFEEVLRSLRGIHIKDGDGWEERIVLHEYGHFVMEKYADFWPPDSKLDHDYDQAYDPEHAWVEGWAHFFSAAVRHWAGYPKADYTENRPIETNYPGDSVEAAVAGVLWDIYDSDNEPGDDLSLGFGPIWDILTTYNPPGDADHPWNIYDFWDGWYESWWWWWHGYRYSLWNIFVLHGMDVPPDNTPPSNPTDIRSSHFPYVWSSDNTVDVWWGPAADDISGAQDYLVIWDNSPATVPELNAPGTTLVTARERTNVTSPPLLGANWWFHVRTRDNAGNWATGATHYGPFYIEAEISISVIPTTIIYQYHYGARSPTIIGSTTVPPGSEIKLKIAGGPGGGVADRVDEYEAWSELTWWPGGTLRYVIYATVDSQGQFTAQFDAGDMRGRFSAIALWYDGSRYWHRSDRFEFRVEGLWIDLEVIPDTIYPNEPAMIFGSTNLPPGTEWGFIYWATHVWPYTPDPESPWNKVVVDPDGNFMDVYAPPPGGWTEGEWGVTDMRFFAYFQVVPLPPPKISITPSTATLQPTLGSSVTYAISIQNDAPAWPIQNDLFHPKRYGPTDTFSVSLIPPQASDLYGAGWAKLDFQYQTWLTVPRGQTRVMNLTVMAKGEPVLLGDYEFGVSASYVSWPRSTNTAQATLRVDFTPTLPAAPTGGLAIAVQPKTTYMSAGTTYQLNIYVKNNQNFDDAITIDISNSGIPTQYQADLNWFSWTSAKVFVPAASSITLQLAVTIPPETSPGYKFFKAEAISTAWTNGYAKDSGIFRLQ